MCLSFLTVFLSFSGTKANGDLLRAVKVCGGQTFFLSFCLFFLFVLSCAIKGDFLPFFFFPILHVYGTCSSFLLLKWLTYPTLSGFSWKSDLHSRLISDTLLSFQYLPFAHLLFLSYCQSGWKAVVKVAEDLGLSVKVRISIRGRVWTFLGFGC